MRKYLIMLAVFMVWCILLPAATNFAKEGLLNSNEQNPKRETQESEDENSKLDIWQQFESIILPIEESPFINESYTIPSTNESQTETVSQPKVDDTSKNDIKTGLPPQSATAKLNYINVYNHKTGKIMRLELEEYVIGLVYAEVPSSFDVEAIKAQAIAARSYIVHNYMSKQRMSGHAGAELCTNPAHCCAYYTKEDMAARYGNEFAEKSYKIIKDAVDATKGMVMTYNGTPANTVFHASSSGFTEDCVEVWGNNLPYLVSVSTPDESKFYGFYSRSVFTAVELKSKLSLGVDALKGDPSTWVKNFEKNSSGRCVTITIGDKTYTGEQLRKRLGLRSTMFRITKTDNGLCFDTEGYGHGVGMSQYGADIMAKQGKTTAQILLHYYTGVKIETIKQEWFK